MSQELERVYTINLGKVLLSADNRRAKRAINMIKEFARHHMKIQVVKIEEDVAHQIWKRGIKHPPRKIRVRMTKTDEGFVLVSSYEEEIESKVKPEEEKPKVEEKPEVETPVKEVEETTEETTEDVKEAPAKKPMLDFYNPAKGHKFYVKRYTKEEKYKAWFERNHPDYTFYEAIGITEDEYNKLADEVEAELGKPKKEAPKKVAPKKVAPKKEAPKKVAPKKETSKKVAPKKEAKEKPKKK